MRRAAIVTLLLPGLLGVACARDRDLLVGPSEPLTCDLLQDATNCWATTAAQVRGCLPGDSSDGILSSDRTACLFADGTEVRFETALPVTADELTRLSFRVVEPGGAVCATVTDDFDNRIVIEGETTAVSELQSSERFVLTCGGDIYEASFEEVSACPAGTQPTDSFVVQPDEVSFSLWSVTTPGPLFSCSR